MLRILVREHPAGQSAALLLATLQFVLQSKSAQIDVLVTLGAWGPLRHLVRVASSGDDLLIGAHTGGESKTRRLVRRTVSRLRIDTSR